MSDRLVIFLHGVGSRGADLAGLGDLWQDALPGTVFAAPDGPFPFDFGGNGRQWFSVAGVTDGNRPERVREARAAFNRMIEGVVTEQGFADRLDRVALVGFSQGSIMALDAVASGRWPVGAVVAFSGRFASPPPLAATGATPVLLVHGTADPTMPIALCGQAETALSELGFDVEVSKLGGIGHQISPDGANRAADFLARRLTDKGRK
ncbi:alpha/beta hydrolase [Sphingobium yanoikuyae]|uniref:alpha/beta hydrolase n=1 Tax=Sphingobium yanoikuyae TaxID=13690 RepID=UPI0022DD2565|nr:dienelactone hydrolase family protein [Sphingobium yanoikuyae]WBQ17602.1 dienelactone hydrolase family protein [Sphingobium yanoikuyae]